jgi:acetolactate synthase-1/2/3 large subunit
MADSTHDGAVEIAEETGAASLLSGLRRAGITHMFSNSGTDFPPIIEAMAALPASDRPEVVLVPHETAGVAMAHGWYLVTGQLQATIVHVNVGLANSVMGLINAASDDVPVVMMSGRTPITETGRPGGRVSPIQYGQEMYDQSAMVAEVCKFRYEMRYPEQGAQLAARAVALAQADPPGPVYLSLPREPLMETVPGDAVRPAPSAPVAPPAPDPRAIATLAGWISEARAPLVLAQRGDTGGRVGRALADLADRHALAVVEPFVVRNVMATNHPMLQGYNPGPAIEAADLIIVLDTAVPWIEGSHRPRNGQRVVHIGPDPQFRRMPVRGYHSDLSVISDAAMALEALAAALPEPGESVTTRHALFAKASAHRRAAAVQKAKAGAGAPMSAEWLSHCLSEAMDENAIVFSELGVLPGFMRFSGANRLFSNPHSGGLGWALPAALGAQMADRDRLVIACIGDGSYMFANPVACHQIAEAQKLPLLTVVKNNRTWNAVRRAVLGSYPDGAAARANQVPLTSLAPLPDFTMIAAASRAHAERVTRGEDLPDSLARALHVIRTERRQAFLDVTVELSDSH